MTSAVISATTPHILPWRDPAEVAFACGDLDGAAALLSDGGEHGRWSYVMASPERTECLQADDPRDWMALLREMAARAGSTSPKGEAPFRSGVLGLAAYEFGARIEPVALPRADGWPDLILARYPTVLAFDHHARRIEAHGDVALARAWLDQAPPPPRPGVLAAGFAEEGSGEAYEAAVADVTARIAAGELFQANIARFWSGELAADAGPRDVAARLAAISPAPFAAFWSLGDLALASNSPERFVSLRRDAGGLIAETRPIKGTRPRGGDAAEDARLAAELAASEKDRAENLMIVDLMRNDLSRVCDPGSVETVRLFAPEAFANVHHLTSTVRGRLSPGLDAADLLRAAFPPGSITGAPKVQAMKTIALHEGARGPWCGSLFWIGFDGAMDASVLIRTAALQRRDGVWRWRAGAGAGIVADSDPRAERLETEAKISALRRALTEAS